MSDNMLWLQHFIDERIERALKPSGVTPNQVINGVTYDRFGRAVRAVASSGNEGRMLAYAYMDADQTLAGTFASTRIRFDTVLYDPDSLITTGASWVFTAPSDGFYYFETATAIVKGANAFVDADSFDLLPYVNSSNLLLANTARVSSLDEPDTPLALPGRITLPMDGSSTFHFKIKNRSSNSHTASSSLAAYIAIFEGPKGNFV